MVITHILQWADYLVIAVMLMISIGIGIYYRFTGGKQKTIEEYFSANRSMSILPVGIALMVSFMSAITLLGVSAENYVYGTQFVVINLSYLLCTPIVCYGFLPVFYQLQGTSVYEYLEKRFGGSTRVLASFALWIQLLLYSGIVLYAPAIAFETTTGLSKTASILIVGLACAFYSSIGGIKAVLITDVFQAFLMFASLLLVIFTASSAAGGFGEIWNIAERGGRIEFDNFSIDPTTRHSWWSLIIGGGCTFLSLYAVNQVQVQRLLTVRSLKSARAALWINWPILTALSIITCFSGLAIYSKYHDCDPIKDQKIKFDMLMPYYVMNNMSEYPGLPGLFIAGIFSAGLSTISAALNSLSAMTLEDYIKPLYSMKTGNEMSPKYCLVLSKVLAFLIGLASILLAFLAHYLGGILQASLTIFGVVGGPLLGLFTLGMLCESANQRGAITGFSAALAFLLWIAFGGPRPNAPRLPTSTVNCNPLVSINETLAAMMQTFAVNQNVAAPGIGTETEEGRYFYLYRISYLWYAPLGALITLILGWLASQVSKCFCNEEEMYVNPNLFFPCIAARIRRRMQKDIDIQGIPGSIYAKKYSFSLNDPAIKLKNSTNI
ncbi:putative sodium-dependent multivitamin transporter [Fopius arisanus]|uniref:Sodium-dependent multivitamin transporter n=1 Tax=Fopius arisanus TaxID=64838 RepID=A0A9R1TIZ7_9HYME|nr:PREDICTED: putative sodium-dependent multivitamin transporter [Fopius arisanus]XP_011310487.1 PREDICTED: putative sodium-dependent multivitamin transporter [Fopius arisanus]